MDIDILLWINSAAGRSMWLDYAMAEASRNFLLKGVVPATCIWILWFLRSEDVHDRRLRLMSTLVVTVLAIGLGRLLSLSLPFRDRPLRAGLADLNQPLSVSPDSLNGWSSSMPSDHAVYFFAIAVSIFMIHRGFGVFLLLHALLVVCLPRVFLGLHWPSDIFVGAIIGLIAALSLGPIIARFLDRSGLAQYLLSRDALLYPLAYVITFELGTMFIYTRALVGALLKLVMLG